MSSADVLTIHTDGAARGNPGPAAFAYVIDLADGSVIEEAGKLGRMTNNQAEYIGLVRALEHAVLLGTNHRLEIHSDSELMVKQMSGEYRVKNEDLRDLYVQAQKLRGRFPSVVIRHVRRAQNSHADRLCNEALDGRRSPQHEPALRAELGKRPAETASASSPKSEGPSLHAEAIACLGAAAVSWAEGDPTDPPPAEVWKQLRELMKRAKAQRKHK
jgi:ribonuclease HI